MARVCAGLGLLTVVLGMTAACNSIDADVATARASVQRVVVGAPVAVFPDASSAALEALALPRARGPEFLRGVSLGMFVSSREDPVRRRYYRQFLDEIAALGATDLQLVVRWAQADVRATALHPDPRVSTDDALLQWVVEEARSRGLRVFLLPIVHLLDRSPGDWRGQLRPSDWDAWWRSYTRFVLHYALLSERAGVHLLAVGSELLSTERSAGRWRTLIAAVRRAFSGQLTYSANWDHFESVAFWDSLDLLGVTGYQALSTDRDPDEASLIAGFDAFKARVTAWSAGSGLPFVLTEVGYPSRAGAAAHPWDYEHPGTTDLQLQLRCYRALFAAWQEHPMLAGLYVWNWFGRGGMDDAGYTPRNKPAASVLAHWFASTD